MQLVAAVCSSCEQTAACFFDVKGCYDERILHPNGSSQKGDHHPRDENGGGERVSRSWKPFGSGLPWGRIAIPANVRHTSLCAEGIGKGLRTKINVNLGISGDANNYEVEMDKVRMALRFGAEAIMDLSNYGKTNTFRQQLIELSPAMIGTVPMYDAIGYLRRICWRSPLRTSCGWCGPTPRKGWTL